MNTNLFTKVSAETTSINKGVNELTGMVFKHNLNNLNHAYLVEFNYEFLKNYRKHISPKEGEHSHDYSTINDIDFLANDTLLYTAMYGMLGCSQEQFKELVYYLASNPTEKVAYVNKIALIEFDDEPIQNLMLSLIDELKDMSSVLINPLLPFFPPFNLDKLLEIGFVYAPISDMYIYNK